MFAGIIEAFWSMPCFPGSSASVQTDMLPLLRMRTLGSKIPTLKKMEEFNEDCSAVMTTSK